MSHSSVSRRYARFVLGSSPDDLPASVTDWAALRALDTLGSCLASSRQEFGRAVLQAAELVRLVTDLAAQPDLAGVTGALRG